MSWEPTIQRADSATKPPPQCDYKKPLAIVGAVLICLAALVATYYWDPTFQSFVNNTFTKIQSAIANVHLTTPQALLYIALPIGGVALTIGCTAHIHRTHQRRLEDRTLLLDDGKSSVLYTLKEMKPTSREWTIAGVAAAALILIGIGGFAIFQYAPHANQWIEQIFSHKFELWQAIVYVGGGTSGTALMIGLTVRAIQCCNEQKEEKQKWEAQTNQ